MNASTNRWVAVGFIVPLLCIFLWMVRSVIVPVSLGALFAVILYPLVPLLQRRAGPLRGFVPAFVVILAMLLVIIPMTSVVVMSVRTLREASGERLGEMREVVRDALTQQLQRVEGLAETMGWHLDGAALRRNVLEAAQDALHAAGQHLGDAASGAPQLVVSGFLLVFALYFFLRDGPRLVAWVGQLVPFSDRETGELFDSVRQAIRGVVMSSILTGLLQSALSLLAMLICGVPGAFVWSVIAFMLSFLPMIGTTPVTLGSVAYLALSEEWGAAGGMLVAAVVIGLSDNVVRPLAQGVHGDMHPLLTLVAIFGGLEALGAGGIFLGPVLAAVAVWSVETYAEWRGPRVQSI